MRSLRRAVFYWLFPLLMATLALNAWLTWLDAVRAVDFAYDRTLRASIRAIAERIYVKDGVIQSDVPYAALEAFEGSDRERVFYAVIGPNGAALNGYTDLPTAKNMPSDGRFLAFNAPYRDVDLRVGIMSKRLFAPELSGRDTVQVVVAETTDSRRALIRDIFMETLRRDVLMALIFAGVLAVVLVFAFRPLIRLRDLMQARQPDDLTPIPLSLAPGEVRPLIEAMNEHTARIGRMLQARKRFLADAAHQLRTPLAVLSTQVDYALRQPEPDELQQTLAGMRQSLRRMRRMTNQLLSLSRAESANGLVLEQASLDFAVLVREVALEITPLAIARQQDLSYHGPEREVHLHGNRAMLHELLLNLLDNAVRYTPTGGRIELSLAQSQGATILWLRDSGVGIPPAEREQVFSRFYRLAQTDVSEGSGLGLAIVREIATAHAASVSLDSGLDGQGLGVKLCFTQ